MRTWYRTKKVSRGRWLSSSDCLGRLTAFTTKRTVEQFGHPASGKFDSRCIPVLLVAGSTIFLGWEHLPSMQSTRSHFMKEIRG